MEKSYIQCGSFSRKKISLFLLVELETALAVWFNQVCMLIAEVSSPQLKQKVLYLVHRLSLLTVAG
jgi:hypothetical protein